MKLQDVFNQLSSGEFAQLSIGGQAPGVINEQNYKQAIDHINLGLVALFRRFHLKENRLVLSVKPNLTQYVLNSQFAVANGRSNAAVRFIMDDAHNPFRDDIMKVTRVLTDRDLELALNDLGDRWSCLTPNLTTLVIPKEIAVPTTETPKYFVTNYLTVVYRAAHPVLKVGLGYFDPNRVDLELPPTYLEALLYFIAARVNTPIGMAQEGMAGNNFYSRYERACRDLDDLNLEVDQGSMENRARKNGWA